MSAHLRPRTSRRTGPGLAPSALRHVGAGLQVIPGEQTGWQGDVTLPRAARARFGELEHELRNAVRKIKRDAEPDSIHDLRVAVRRLEVALGEFARVVDADDQRALARELGRLMKRLGDVRDLDVLLEALSDGSANAIEPLRKAWQRDRRRAEKQLRRELAGRRFRRFRTALHRVAGPGVPSASSRAGLDAQHPPRRLGPDAAVHVLASLADVLAYSIDPVRSDVRAIHGLRISAKQLRDTLRGYEDVFGPESRRLADRVGELQDVAGALHDADVAARRARRFLRRHGLATDAMVAIRAFAADQDDRVSRQRATLVGHVADIRGDAFRMRAAALVTDGIRAHRPAGDGIG